MVAKPASMSRVFGGSSRCSGERPSNSAYWSEEPPISIRLRSLEATTNSARLLPVTPTTSTDTVDAGVTVKAISLLLVLEEFEERLHVLGRCRRLAELTLEAVIQPVFFDERLCVIEHRIPCFRNWDDIANVTYRLRVSQRDWPCFAWDLIPIMWPEPLSVG